MTTSNKKRPVPLPLHDWDASLSHIKQDMNGQPLNIHSLMANHPEFLKDWWSFRNYTVHKGELSQRQKELIILRVAVLMQTWYEWAAHVTRGIECGLTLEEIERVRQGGAAPGWSEDEAILLTAVDELSTGHRLSEDTQQEMGKYYSNNQIMDLISIYGVYNIIACMINTWGLEVDQQFAEKLPSSVTREGFN